MVRFATLVAPAHLLRTALVFGVVAVAALGGAGLKASISADVAAREVEARLGAFLGTPVRLGGTGSVRLLPWPGLRFDAVSITRIDTGAAEARMDALDVRLDVAALLLGRLAPEELRLRRPDIHLDSATLTDARADRLGAWQSTNVVIEDGRLAIAAPTGEEVLDAIDLRWSWPRPSSDSDLRAKFRWHGEPVDLRIEAPAPTELAAGRSGPLNLRFISAPLRANLTGRGGLGAPIRFEGAADLDVTDAPLFAHWVGRPVDPTLLAGRLRLAGQLTVTADGATLASAATDLAGSRGEGVLALRWDGARPNLAGTLAFAGLDLTRRAPRPFGEGWRKLALDHTALDLDLRLSTPTLKTTALTLERVAAAIHLAEGRIHAEIGDADLFGKPVSLVLRGTLDGEGLRAQIKGNADDLPASRLGQALGVAGIEAGRASLTLDAETRCRELAACLGAVDGRLRTAGRAMTVVGASPFGDVTRFHPIVLQPSGATRAMTWERADVDIHLLGPRAEVERVEILGQGSRFLLAGTADFTSGAVDLLGQAYFPAFRPDPARNGTSEIAIPLRIGGTLRRLEAIARDGVPAAGDAPKPTP